MTLADILIPALILFITAACAVGLLATARPRNQR